MRLRRAVVFVVTFATLLPAARVVAQPPTPSAALGTAAGVVYDSLARRPLAGAIVQIVRVGDEAAGRAAAVDSAGAFRIDSLAPGRYLVGFTHPVLDLLRVEAAPRFVEVGPGGGTLRVDLAVPSLASVRRVVCGSAQEPADSSGLLAGLVRDAADGAPVAGARVVLAWTELSLGAGGLRKEHRRVLATTGPGGGYVVCGVPAGEEIVATAAASGRASGDVPVELPPRGFVVRDLVLANTTAAPVARGTARLAGTVRDAAGQPVRGAQVVVWGTSASAAAGPDGAFVLGGLPAGTRTLEVRAIGFVFRRVPVDLGADRTATVDVRMERVTNLDTVTVLGAATPASPLIREFLDRQRTQAFGRFLTAADIARTKPLLVSDAFRSLHGASVVSNGRLGYLILGRNRQGGSCLARLILNGVPIPGGDAIDDWVSPDAVAGIEFYVDAAYAPPQYETKGGNGCSVALVWTRP